MTDQTPPPAMPPPLNLRRTPPARRGLWPVATAGRVLCVVGAAIAVLAVFVGLVTVTHADFGATDGWSVTVTVFLQPLLAPLSLAGLLWAAGLVLDRLDRLDRR